MEYSLIEIRKPEEIFIDIREQEVIVNDPYKGIAIPINEYVMLHSSTGYFRDGDDIAFLGLNKIFKQVDQKRNATPVINRKSFWLRNSELFAIACSILYNWVSEEEQSKLPKPKENFLPENWRKILKARVITVDPARNWFGFLIDLNNIKQLFTGTKFCELLISLEEKGYSLTMLIENGFGYNVTPNIYLQISSLHTLNFSQSFNQYFNFNSLTLEKTNFKVQFSQKPEELFNPFSKDYSLSNINSLCANHASSFMSAISNFNYLFDLMQKMTLDERSYNALLLDLYDVNRNESSVDLDDRLKNLILKKIRQGHYGTDNQFNWASIIRSVIINNANDLHSKIQNNPYEITNLFSKKRVIEKMERIYKEIFGRKDHKMEMEKYIYKQVESYREIEQHINF